MQPPPTADEFQQYRYGPNLPRSLFAINVENSTKEMNYRRRQSLKEIRYATRSQRELNAIEYLEWKRDHLFLLAQAKPN